MAKTECISIREILSFYDFPRLFVAEASGGNKYLCWFIDEDGADEDFVFLCVPLRGGEADLLREGVRTVYSVFLECGMTAFFIARWDDEGLWLDRSRRLFVRSIPSAWFPGEQYYCCSSEKMEASKRLKFSRMQGVSDTFFEYISGMNSCTKLFLGEKHDKRGHAYSMGRKLDCALA